jgi:opacity protein-like surface antigen
MLKKCVLMAALVVLLAPGSARADWLFTPNIGGGFGGDASGREHLTYGASIGWMGAGIVGWEADFAYTPEFFESDDNDLDAFDSNNVTSFMANAIVGIPVGGQTGGGIRPYFAAGLGLLQREVADSEQLFEFSNNEFGFSLGAGAMGFMTDHVGFRGDLRYYRSLEDPVEDNEFDIGVGNFDFWRATGGVTFRF